MFKMQMAPGLIRVQQRKTAQEFMFRSLIVLRISLPTNIANPMYDACKICHFLGIMQIMSTQLGKVMFIIMIYLVYQLA